jgi:hypothetical protein
MFEREWWKKNSPLLILQKLENWSKSNSHIRVLRQLTFKIKKSALLQGYGGGLEDVCNLHLHENKELNRKTLQYKQSPQKGFGNDQEHR